MNTSDSTSITRGRIGLIELPALAETLTQCGLQVVTGPDFRAAATSIIAESKTAGAFPIVVADVPAPGLRAWVGHLQTKTPVKVAVVRDTENPVVVADSVAEILLPTTINSILASVGLAPLDGPAGLQAFPPAAVEPVGIDLPDIDLFDEEPEHQAAAPAALAIPAAFSGPVAAPAPAEEDPFADAAPTAPAAVFDDWDEPAPVAAPAPAPVLDEWDTAPAVQSYEPAAVPVAAPAPVQPAPVQDEWDSPAVPTQAPPASRRAARAQQEQDWTAPAAAAPVTPAPTPAPVATPAPAPVLMAAPVQMAAPHGLDDWDAPQYQAPVAAPVMAPPAEEFGDWDTPELPVAPVRVAVRRLGHPGTACCSRPRGAGAVRPG